MTLSQFLQPAWGFIFWWNKEQRIFSFKRGRMRAAANIKDFSEHWRLLMRGTMGMKSIFLSSVEGSTLWSSPAGVMVEQSLPHVPGKGAKLWIAPVLSPCSFFSPPWCSSSLDEGPRVNWGWCLSQPLGYLWDSVHVMMQYKCLWPIGECPAAHSYRAFLVQTSLAQARHRFSQPCCGSGLRSALTLWYTHSQP